MDKIEFMNQEGVKNGIFYTPKPWLGSGSLDKEKLAKQTEALQKILPPGTIIKSKDVTAPQMKKAGFEPGQKLGGVKAPAQTKEQEKEAQSHDTKEATSTGQTFHLPHSPEYGKTESFSPKLTQHEENAIQAWKTSATGIRKEISSGNLTGQSKAILSMLGKGGNYVGTVYRGVSNQYSKDQMEAIEKMGVGGKWIDTAPHCTSIDPAIGAGFAYGKLVFKIESKTACPIHHEDGHVSEKEAMGRPNTVYQVEGIHKNVTVKYKGYYGAASSQIEMMVHLKEL